METSAKIGLGLFVTLAVIATAVMVSRGGRDVEIGRDKEHPVRCARIPLGEAGIGFSL